MTKPKILIYDIETATTEGHTWGVWNTNVLDVTRPSYMLCYGYRWHGEDGETQVVSLRDFPRYRRDKKNDKDLVRSLGELIDEADILVAHNGKAFDIKKFQARQFFHGFAKCSHFQWVDTLSVCRRNFKHESNKLDSIAKLLGVGKKLQHTGLRLWLETQAGSDEAFELMERYCGVDVDILVEVYDKLRNGGWITDHPNVSVIDGTMRGCPKGCKGDTMRYNGTRKYKTRAAAQYRCDTCRSYATARHDGTKKGPMFS